jgi:hypothetical protein
MSLLETYLSELAAIRSSGAAVKETSYYAPLANLLNEIGRTLKPKVRCILTLKNQGAGLPDGGLFTPDQFQRAAATEPLPGQVPSCGVIEVKGTRDDAWLVAEGTQVSRYWGKYGQVLVTNYRDFVLVGRDADGKPAKLETYRLARSESDFWSLAAHPRKAAQEHGERFIEYLKRVLLHAAPLGSPADVAWLLASYARDAKARVDVAELPALAAVRTALEESLGLKFEGEKGEHFFRSSLVQTLFYGVFAAWVLWSREHPPGDKARFNWHEAEWSLHVPMIRALYEQLARRSSVESLGLAEVLDWAAAALNRVDRAAFFEKFEQRHAVQYFYEPFLEAFDPGLRKELGVWYTPPEIVEYMVARVDRVLREELAVADGLADPDVYVLDPCCGTGAYVVEVLRSVAETLRRRGGEDATTAWEVKKAAMERVFGFEILPAPFVIAHLQMGLLLQQLGVPLSAGKKGQGERAAVYLTNALTGWEPPKGPKRQLLFPELEEEREAAERVKRQVPILVVLGNPPYNAFAGVSPAEEQGLVEPYKAGLVREWGIKKFNLDDLYVRFFRLAERRIVEGKEGRGVVCYISNFSYLDDPSFVVMRRRFLDGFDAMWFDCMNGDSRETGKLTPDGKPDPSVFSTELNREGIRVGTTIGLMVRRGPGGKRPSVRYREFWGATKRADLVETLDAKRFNSQYETARPAEENRYSFRPYRATEQYRSWPRVTDLAAIPPFNGPIERRGNSLIVLPSDRGNLALVSVYLDAAKTDEEVRIAAPRFMKTSGEFDAQAARAALKGAVKFDPAKIVPYPFKPLDVRLAYLDECIAPLFSRPSPGLLRQRFPGNAFFITRDTADKSPEGPPFYFSPLVVDYDCISGHARHFPVLLKNGQRLDKNAQRSLFATLGESAEESWPVANLSKRARSYLHQIRVKDPDADPDAAALIWLHALAIGFSPAYLSENADGIRQDWPRVPLPEARKALERSAALGRQLAELLDAAATDATWGAARPELKAIAVPTRLGGGALQAADFALTAGWGHAGQGGVTMPGKGRLVSRDYTPEERQAIHEGARAMRLSARETMERLGSATTDVYLNDVAYWRNVPQNVWQYVLGGYQVIKKWLSYREKDLLGRALTMDEVRELTGMARRVAAVLLLGPALDANYQAIRDAAFVGPQED